MLVWYDSEICIAWPTRAPLACHAKTQLLMWSTQLRTAKKTCHAGQHITECSLFPSLHHKFPDPDKFAIHNAGTTTNQEDKDLQIQHLQAELLKQQEQHEHEKDEEKRRYKLQLKIAVEHTRAKMERRYSRRGGNENSMTFQPGLPAVSGGNIDTNSVLLNAAAATSTSTSQLLLDTSRTTNSCLHSNLGSCLSEKNSFISLQEDCNQELRRASKNHHHHHQQGHQDHPDEIKRELVAASREVMRSLNGGGGGSSCSPQEQESRKNHGQHDDHVAAAEQEHKESQSDAKPVIKPAWCKKHLLAAAGGQAVVEKAGSSRVEKADPSHLFLQPPPSENSTRASSKEQQQEISQQSSIPSSKIQEPSGPFVNNQQTTSGSSIDNSYDETWQMNPIILCKSC